MEEGKPTGQRILAIAGTSTFYPRASRPLMEDEPSPEAHAHMILPELDRPVYIYDVDSEGPFCYLSEDEVRQLALNGDWTLEESRHAR